MKILHNGLSYRRVVTKKIIPRRTDDHSRTVERQGGRERRVQGGEELLRVRQSRQIRLCRVQSWRRSRRVRDNGKSLSVVELPLICVCHLKSIITPFLF